MGFGRCVAVHGYISTFKGCSGNRLDIRNTIGSGHADGDIAARSDRGDRNLDGTSLANEGSAVKHAVLADGHVRTRHRTHLIGLHTDRKNGHVTHLVGSRLHTVRHDGAVTQHVVGLPIIKSLAVKLISKGSCGIARKEANI